MDKIGVVLNKILDDSELSKKFMNLEEIDDVRKFIKDFDNEITDDELSEFLKSAVLKVSSILDDDLENVSGGLMNKRILSWPMAVLAALSVASPSNFALEPINAQGDAVVSSVQEKKEGWGAKILSWFKSGAPKEEINDDYMMNGFLSRTVKTTLSNSMESRKKVFLDTLRYCIKNKDNLSINFDEDDFVSNASEVIHHNHKNFMKRFSKDKITNNKPATIWLTNGKSLQSLNAVNARLKINPKDVKNAVVLNFANYYCPGGGVIQGCTAQEECLCRITNLYPHLATKTMKRDFYSKHTLEPKNIDDWRKSGIANESIYTKDIKQIKEDYTIGRVGEYVDGCQFNVITAAAPDFRMHDLKDSEIPKYKELMKDLWRMILSTAYKHGDKHLVLGALGCGAFRNDPKLVSETFYNVLNEKGPGGKAWAYCFDNIILPIYTSNKSDQRNYSAFKESYDKQYGPLYKISQTEIDLPSVD